MSTFAEFHISCLIDGRPFVIVNMLFWLIAEHVHTCIRAHSWQTNNSMSRIQTQFTFNDHMFTLGANVLTGEMVQVNCGWPYPSDVGVALAQNPAHDENQME